MARQLFFFLGFLLCLAGAGWYFVFSVPDIVTPALQMIESTRKDQFERQREILVELVRFHCGDATAGYILEGCEPLGRESAQWNPTGQFTPPAIGHFWMSLAVVQNQLQEEHVFPSLVALLAGCASLLFSLVIGLRDLSKWENLPKKFLPHIVPSRVHSLHDFQAFYAELVGQKERALERVVALTFSLQRERRAKIHLREELAARKSPHAQTRLSPPPAANPQSLLQPPVPPTGSSPPDTSAAVPADTESKGKFTSPVTVVSSPMSSGPMPSGPASPEVPPVEAPPVQDMTSGFGREPKKTTATETTSATSIKRLLAEKPISSADDLLPYIPRFENFSSVEQLRQRSSGVVVEIRPSVEGLLMLAKSYGPSSIEKYYALLIAFLDRCFIAFPSDLAQEKYSIYWYSRVSDLEREELLSTIQGEMPYLQWVGGEGVISQVELEIVLHRPQM